MSGRSMFANEVRVCAGCGYPTLGPDVCYFCRPLVATALLPFRRSPAGATDTAEEAPVIACTTAWPRREPHADAERSLSNNEGSTYAAAG